MSGYGYMESYGKSYRVLFYFGCRIIYKIGIWFVKILWLVYSESE